MKKIIVYILVLQICSFAGADDSLKLIQALGKYTVLCQSSNKSSEPQISIKSNGKKLLHTGLDSFGGRGCEFFINSHFTVASCGDDGRQTTLFSFGSKDSLKEMISNDFDSFDGSVYSNISPGHPYTNGNVEYLICKVK